MKWTISTNTGQTPSAVLTSPNTEFEPRSALHHQSFFAQLFSVGLFFFKIPNFFKHLRQLPLECFAPEFELILVILAQNRTFSLSVLCLSLDYSRDHFQSNQPLTRGWFAKCSGRSERLRTKKFEKCVYVPPKIARQITSRRLFWSAPEFSPSFIMGLDSKGSKFVPLVRSAEIGAMRVKLTNMLSIFAGSLGQAGIPFWTCCWQWLFAYGEPHFPSLSGKMPSR